MEKDRWVPAVQAEANAADAPAGESLAAAAVRGDPAAVRALWQEHRRWVAAVLLAHKPREMDLDDLLQEVATIVVAKVAELRDEGAIKPWLRSVAISVARTAARRKRPESWWRRAVGERAHGTDEGEGLKAHSAIEEGRRLMTLAQELPDGYREPLLLKCVRGLSYRQIGELLGLPETTIETRIARARRMLKEAASKSEAEGDEAAADSSADTEEETNHAGPRLVRPVPARTR